MKEKEAVIELKHITMEFPGVLANDDISLSINPGEVFALVGENGAGKSTLMNIIYGILTPTDGEMFLRGKKVEVFSPKAAIDMGIGMVHQHFKLVPSFTVAQNIVLSKEPRRGGLFFDEKKAVAITEKLAAEYGLTVDPTAKVEDISVGLQQRVEILKALYRGADILILDEPTAVLTPQETDELFRVIRHIIREKHMTVVIITHKLGEVMAISDRVGIMRQGRLVGLHETRDVDEKKLASLMVGRPVLFDKMEKTGTPGDVCIRTEKLRVRDNRGLMAVKDVSLSVRAGEILGIAAVEGNGQSELLEALTGMRPAVSGRAEVRGKSVLGLTPGQIRQLGLAHIPEDRIATGVDPKASVTDNLLTGKHRNREFGGLLLRRSTIERYASALYERYDIRGAGIQGQAGSMSGGNMQKVVVAREFSHETPVLIISNPSRGVDIGAMEFIHTAITEKRNAGCAILLSSADLDELTRLSDRIITLYEGRITGEFKTEEVTKETLGYCMTGGKGEKV